MLTANGATPEARRNRTKAVDAVGAEPTPSGSVELGD
jgi:hypothetical protein